MKRTFFTIILLFCSLSCGVIVKAAGGAEMAPPSIHNEKSIIKSFLIVCDDESIRYSLFAAAEKGVKFIELKSAATIINHKECYGAGSCMVSGATPKDQLPSDIITAHVASTGSLEQKEKTRIIFEAGETKVYFIGSVPGFSSMPTAVVASADANNGNDEKDIQEKTGTAKTIDKPGKTELTAPPKKGPEITVQVRKTSSNDFTVKILARDETGIDFIEILENGSFIDVQICGNKKECTFVKELKKRKPGRNRYLIKSMNSEGALSFQEELISFTR